MSWQIHVTNPELAELQLLPLLMVDEAARVVEFGHKKQDLEDVFVNLVGESEDESE